MSTPVALPEWPAPETLGLRGSYRDAPEAFRVEEVSGWQISGEGEHLLCEVEKTGLNSADLAERLAALCSARPADVGYCGNKDRHAVTRQWFSVRTPIGFAWPDEAPREEFDARGAGWRLLTTARHGRKLRRGDHGANRFRLVLRLAAEAEGGLPSADVVRAVLERGVPNYFGPQRFGRGYANLTRARRWAEEGARLPPRGNQRGFTISAARSLLFNEVVAARVRARTIERCMDGDVAEANLPTGPLWGRGRSATDGAAAEIERAALEPWALWCRALEHAGLSQERRPLVLKPKALEVEVADDRLILAFTLAPGAFATALLPALGAFVDAAAQAPTEGAAA
ncbi:MAG: tRNA pseudouridine(13) synthase TruD [Pseudomonadota bacterium]|nr:tRNA pseudouridine(13) synthase TruD [Pseudomonadota bacterium]